MSSFNSALIDCLDRLRHGATIEDCLQRYPKHSQKLYPQLTLAHRVMRTPPATVRPQAQQRAWETVSLRAAQMRAGKTGVVKMPRARLQLRSMDQAARLHGQRGPRLLCIQRRSRLCLAERHAGQPSLRPEASLRGRAPMVRFRRQAGGRDPPRPVERAHRRDHDNGQPR